MLWLLYPFFASLLLGLFMQHRCAYDFFYAEQNHVFLYNGEYVAELTNRPGGMVECLASFLTQFYVHPYAGALSVSVLFFFLLTGIERLCRRLSPCLPLPFFGLVICLFLMVLETDANYRTEGTLSMLLAVWMLNIYVGIKKDYLRLGVTMVTLPLFYGVAGPAALVVAVCAVLLEMLRWSALRYWVWLLPLCVLIPMYIWWDSGWGEEARIVFLPDAYYSHYVVPHKKIYYPWICLLALFPVAVLAESRKRPIGKWFSGLSLLVQAGAALWIGGYLFILCHREADYQLKRLEYKRWNSCWDDILAEPLQAGRIPIHACYQNLALSQKGMLADKLFHYPQCGPSGLWMPWQGTQYQADLLSDIYQMQGNVAMMQKMAFTAMASGHGARHPRLMLRLIEAALVYGLDEVAEKYIRLCEQTYAYAERASAYRKFLHHPERVDADPVLGVLQHCLPTDDGRTVNVWTDLEQIAQANPDCRTALHYIGCRWLLENKLESFGKYLEAYREAEGLHPLPVHFQEAAVMLLPPDRWQEYGISDETVRRFEDFKQKVQHAGRAGAARAVYGTYGKTFWYYSLINAK